MRDPSFLFYSDNFLTGTMFFSDEQVGKYIRLLCAQHQTGHLEEKHMIFICKGHDKDIFKKFIIDEDGLYYNERLEMEIIKRKKYSESRANNKKGKTKEDKKPPKSYDLHMGNENENEIIDEIYSLYPSKCCVKNTSTGKSAKDKVKIKSLLKTLSSEILKSKIERYISECKSGSIYMKNFSTFLNNLPDFSETSQPKLFSRVNYKIDNEIVTHTRKAYEENLSIYGKERVFFIKEVE